jgi:hypothetical protein
MMGRDATTSNPASGVNHSSTLFNARPSALHCFDAVLNSGHKKQLNLND